MTAATPARQLGDLCRALGHEHRIEIMYLLVGRREGRTVGDLQAALDIPWSTLSHHLEALVRVGLVEKHRVGREHRCLLGGSAVRTLRDLVEEISRKGAQGTA